MAALVSAIFSLAAVVIPSAPARGLAPQEVVEAQLTALQRGDVRCCFSFASPNNRRATGPWTKFERMVKQTPAYAPLVGCTSFEILSVLSVSPRKWRCRVRVRPAGSSSAPFAVADPFVDYSWELSQQGEQAATFSIGQALRHRKYQYRGVIVGFDLECTQSEEWMQMMNVEGLTRGRMQPFYNVLVDERDRPGAQMSYVAEENIVPDSPVSERLQHPAAAELLLSLDKETGTYTVRDELAAQYHAESVAGCWLVDGVIPDRPAVE